ncbi:hypothetical protein RHGRI_010118 [Rhododendron griersonianum]|uniref:F-box domain-containing protein n=1 Tax=Rhododendron griersonianum TaxID=479676 RepID=A0AAV6KH74_9ERIC|nr:hypothetical protein RHGRI_010118 [Rhododendron griersonianum]
MVLPIPPHLASRKERIAKRNARILYSQKKNDKFVVSRERIPAELEKRKLEGQIRPWSYLPSDILVPEVISRFSSFDEIRLRAVCRNWGKLLPPIHGVENRTRPISDDLPWLLDYHWNDDGYRLDDPLVLGLQAVRLITQQALFRGSTFSVANRDWSLVTTSSNLGGLSSGRSHLFERDGQLFFAYLDGHTLTGLDNGECRLFSFSQSRRAWVAKTSFLANQALFLDRTSSFSVSASGETSNKVYYYDQDGTLRFYSFDNGKNHALEGSPYAGWLAATGWIL